VETQALDHTVHPMTEPHPPADQMDARYCDALPWSANSGLSGSDARREPRTRLELEAEYNHALYTVRPFVYFHLGGGLRRIVVDGIEPMDVPGDYIQPFSSTSSIARPSTVTARRWGWRSACRLEASGLHRRPPLRSRGG